MSDGISPEIHRIAEQQTHECEVRALLKAILERLISIDLNTKLTNDKVDDLSDRVSDLDNQDKYTSRY